MSSLNAYPFFKNELGNKKRFVDRILEEAIEKAKISILIPRFLENSDDVYTRLRDTEFHKCAKILRAYVRDENANIIKCKRNVPSKHQEESLLRLIDLFQENNEILNYFPDWLQELKINERTSIAELILLRSTTRDQFQLEAVPQLIQEKELDTIYQENQQVVRNLRSLRKKLFQKQMNLRWKIAARETTIVNLEDDVNRHGENAKKILEKESQNCNIRLDSRNFLPRQKFAEDDLEAAASSFEKTRTTNLQNEMVARGEHNKFAIQLQAIIHKYDQTLSEKYRETIYLEADYDQLKAQHEEFVRRFYNPAEKMYTDIVKAREFAEEQKRLSKIRAFIENRAARLIQLAYRDYLRKHKPELLPKPTKAKGKGKKKNKK